MLNLIGFLGLVKPLQERGKGSSFICILHRGSKYFLLEQSTIFSLSIVGSQSSTLSRFIVFTPPVGFFSNYMGNLSMSPTLQIYFIGPFVLKDA